MKKAGLENSRWGGGAGAVPSKVLVPSSSLAQGVPGPKLPVAGGRPAVEGPAWG